MNPRAAINDLLPFQGAPSTTWVLLQTLSVVKIKMAERVGFEPTVPFGITGFQDQLLKPLGHLSTLLIFLVLVFVCFCFALKHVLYNTTSE